MSPNIKDRNQKEKLRKKECEGHRDNVGLEENFKKPTKVNIPHSKRNVASVRQEWTTVKNNG